MDYYYLSPPPPTPLLLLPIPVAVLSKVWICGWSHAGIVG